MKNWLITGCKGFIASGLQGDGIDIKDGVDIRTYKKFREYETVVHTAAKISVYESEKNPDLYYDVNVNGTYNMIKEHPDAHFIYLSTCAVYGEGLGHTVASRLKPESMYAKTKLMGEHLLKTFAKSCTILRLTNVIGEGERGEPNVYQVFKKAKVLEIYGDGTQTRDFVDVDFVRNCIRIAIDMKPKGIFNVGSGVVKTVNEVADEFSKPRIYLPERKGEIKHFGLLKDADYNITQS